MKLNNQQRGLDKDGELNVAALDRLDTIYGAVETMLNEIIEDAQKFEHDMSIIGPVTELAIELLAERGYNVSYPGVIHEETGDCHYEE